MLISLRNLIFPLVTLVVLVLIWIAYLDLFDVPAYILPQPSAVVDAVFIAYTEGLIWPHIMFTLQSTVIGYLLGCGFGVILGSFIAESRLFEKFVYPYVILLQNMPKVALAPLIIVWFGFEIESKVAMVVLICFFPVFINTIMGIRQTDPELIDVLRASSASRLRIFFKVKAPSAAGTIFAGLQISVTLGLIGAIVAEFVASQKGLGVFIQQASIDLNTAMMLTGVFTLALMGLIGNAIVTFAYRRVVFWEVRNTLQNANLQAP